MACLNRSGDKGCPPAIIDRPKEAQNRVINNFFIVVYIVLMSR